MIIILYGWRQMVYTEMFWRVGPKMGIAFGKHDAQI